MAKPIDELVGLLGFEYDPKALDKFKAGIKDAGALLAKFAAGVGVAVAGTVKLALDTAKAGDDYAKFSRLVDVSVEKIQEYEFAARRQGLTNENVRSTFLSLNKDIGLLKRGLGPLKSSLENVDNTLLQNLILTNDTEEAFLLVIDAIDKAPDQITKTAIATAAFGSAGQEMVNMAKGGVPELDALRKKFVDLGGGITSEAAAASEILIDRWEDLVTAAKNIKLFIGAQLMPVITAVAEKIEKWVIQNRDLIKVKIIDFIKKWIGVLKSALKILGNVFSIFSTLTGLVGGAGNALKILAAGVAVFIAFKLGAIILGIVMAFKSLTIQALIANATVLLIPLAIGIAVAAVVAGFVWLIKNWDTVTDAFWVGLENIKDWFKGLWAAVKENPLFKFLSMVVNRYVDAWKGLFALIKSGFEAVFSSKIFKVVSGIAGKIGGLFKNKKIDVDIKENVNRSITEGGKISGSSAFAATGGAAGSRNTDNSKRFEQSNEIVINTNNPEAAGAAVDQTLKRWSDQTILNSTSPVF